MAGQAAGHHVATAGGWSVRCGFPSEQYLIQVLPLCGACHKSVTFIHGFSVVTPCTQSLHCANHGKTWSFLVSLFVPKSLR